MIDEFSMIFYLSEMFSRVLPSQGVEECAKKNKEMINCVLLARKRVLGRKFAFEDDVELSGRLA